MFKLSFFFKGIISCFLFSFYNTYVLLLQNRKI